MQKPVYPVILVILDGFGYSDIKQYNAITQAHTPYLTRWMMQYPHTSIKASGQAVGLLPGVVGNSEVGHLTIGAGRVVTQPATFIHEAIQNGSFFANDRLQNALQKVLHKQARCHIIGLISDAGVHSTLELMQATIHAAVTAGIRHIVVHAILDGRDVVPQSAEKYLTELEVSIAKYPQVTLGSIHGRFYAMDRDANWDRIEKTYRVLTEPVNSSFADWKSALAYYYSQGVTDEFIPPVQLSSEALVRDGDGLFFTNYRPDRARELTACFVDRKEVPFATKKIALSCFVTPVSYESQTKTTVLFDRPVIPRTLKQVLARHGKTIFSIAETEKYAHVTYFFNGEDEKPVPGETRILVPSIHAKNYVNYPCMSAPEITHQVLRSLQTNPADFYLINYANADMVGHSGDFQATIKAIECLDKQMGLLCDQVQKMGGTLIITADHGKAEMMFDEQTGQPHTGHTMNTVPFLVISQNMDLKALQLPTELSQIAPFILRYMSLDVPIEMKS